ELDTAEPANHQNGHPVTLLAVYGLQNGAPGRATGFAIIIEAIFLTDPVCPTVMRGVRHMMFGEKCHRLGSRFHWRGERPEPALLDVLLVPGGVTQRMKHRLQRL